MDKTAPVTSNLTNTETTKSNSFYKSIALDGPSLTAIINAKTLQITFVNNKFEYYLGYSQQDIEHSTLLFTDLLDEYMHDRLLYQLGTINGDITAQSRYVIYELRSKNGERSSYNVYVSPVTNGIEEVGEESYYLVMQPELSRWDMPFSSFNSRELFLEQFNSEDFGTFEWIIDVDKVFWSLGIYQIYEVDDTKRYIDNLFARDFVHPNDAARIKELMTEAITTGGEVNIEYRIITAKNNIKVIHSIGRMLKNKEGKPVKFVGSIRDVSQQRFIEEDLKNKVAELHHSNRELEEFAYVASHDMQEPLRKITTFSDRLSEKYKDVLAGDGAMYLSRMIASAENMRSLINDLLEFSRISKTAQPFEPINLNVILRMVKTELELTIEETATVIESDSLPTLDAIGSQMKQLFVNIISNAIKFHKPDQSPLIKIKTNILSKAEIITYELPQNATYHKIEISDNGIGFEEEYAQRIFQVFQRLHGKAEYPGSGIGLAICKKILEYHKGIIYAENIPEKGARFIFILPQHQKPKQNI